MAGALLSCTALATLRTVEGGRGVVRLSVMASSYRATDGLSFEI